jgi:hypothetical protein
MSKMFKKLTADQKILFFLSGAFGSIVGMIGKDTTWADMLRPAVVCTFMYMGCHTIIAYMTNNESKGKKEE